MKHLLVDISSHGLGHLAQTAQVINALDSRTLKLTLRTQLSEDALKQRINHPFDLIPYQQDTGMIMHDALHVDVDATMNWYRDFHANYAQRRNQAAKDLEALQPDLLFADIPYLSLDASSIAEIPSVALCSLNWADIFRAYCGHLKGAAAIHAQIENAYSTARYFLQASPSMPMESLPNRQPISPIAQVGNKRQDILRDNTNQPESTRFVLVSLGGIGMTYPLETWPQIHNVCWIFNDEVLYLERKDFIAQSRIELPYTDLLASCDVIMTKTGYGTQTEAVVNHIPTLCVTRGDWPEEPHLFTWHEQHGIVRFMEWSAIDTGVLQSQIDYLLDQTWQSRTVKPTGAAEAATLIEALL